MRGHDLADITGEGMGFPGLRRAGNSGTGGWGGRGGWLDGDISGLGGLAFEGLEGDAVGAHDVAGGAGLEFAGGVAELVDDFLGELGGAGAGGADEFEDGLELAVCGDDFLGLAGGGLEGGVELDGGGIGHGREAGLDGGGIAGDELAGEGAAVFAAGDGGNGAGVVDLVEVEHGGAVFHAEGAAGEDDDVVADVGVQDVLGGEGVGGFLGDLALEGGAPGEEGGVTGKGGAVLLAVTEKGGDLGEEPGGQVAAVLGGIASGGFDGGAEEVDLSGIGAGWANAWHGGGRCGVGRCVRRSGNRIFCD